MRGRAKTLLILVGALLACVAVALVTLRIVGLDPKDRRPGLWLTGDLVTKPVTDWSFTDKYPTIFVQTRSWYGLPHSVTTSCTAHNGSLSPTAVARSSAPAAQRDRRVCSTGSRGPSTCRSTTTNRSSFGTSR